jgi:methionine-rich copper-binding protein CopC
MGPRDGPHAFGMTVDVQTDTRLPEGSYELEMRIKGPDGKEQTAVTNFEIKYAC